MINYLLSFSGSSVPVTSSSVSALSASSEGFLDLDKFKKPEGSWECEVCLVQNKAEATKCIACENAKPGTKAELKGNSYCEEQGCAFASFFLFFFSF